MEQLLNDAGVDSSRWPRLVDAYDTLEDLLDERRYYPRDGNEYDPDEDNSKFTDRLESVWRRPFKGAESGCIKRGEIKKLIEKLDALIDRLDDDAGF